MSKTNYKIGHLMGTLYAEYPTLLYRGSKDAVLQAGHTFVRICDQVTVHRELMDYDEVMFSLILAEKLKLDAYLISPGSIFQLFKDITKFSVDKLVRILPPDRTIILDSSFENYRSISKNNASGMHECMRHLIYDMGYKHIAFIAGQEGSNSSTQRKSIYLEEIRKAGLDVDDTYITHASYWGNCENVVDALLDAHPDIDAIACAVDRIAYSCYNSIKARNLTVGKDIAVTGFDDLPDSAIMNPPLTSVKCNPYDIGRIGALEAIRLCQGLEQKETHLNSKLIVRGSSDPSKNSDIKVSFDNLLSQTPIPWNDVVDEFVRLSWKKEFGAECESYKKGIRNIFKHFSDAYNVYLSTRDTTVSAFKENQLKDFLIKTKVQNDFSLTGLQQAFSDFYKAIKENLSLDAQLYFSEQFSLLNMLISRIYYEDIKQLDSKQTLRESLSMQIMDDALVFSNNRKEAVYHSLQHIKELGFNYALLYNLSKPIVVDVAPEFSDEILYLQGMLYNNEITTFEPTEKNVCYENILVNPFTNEIAPIEVSICPLMSDKLTTGYIVLDESLDQFRQNAVIQMLSYSSRHIYMIEQELEMIKLLNKNNIILSKESTQDALTGLYNRRGFVQKTDSTIKGLVGKDVAFFYMDLDGLKGINDTLGHDLGDSAIKNTAEILKSSFRSSDILCRMGGDEFVAFVELTYVSDVELIIDRINSKINEFNAKNKHEYKLSISIGYKIFLVTGENVKHLSTLLKEADKMLYENKKAKKQCNKKSE